MGMFDWVKREEEKCPKCGHTIKDWQTKCGFNHLMLITPEQLIYDYERLVGAEAEKTGPWYYGYCPVCHTRVDFEWIPGHWERTDGDNI